MDEDVAVKSALQRKLPTIVSKQIAWKNGSDENVKKHRESGNLSNLAAAYGQDALEESDQRSSSSKGTTAKARKTRVKKFTN